MPSCCHSEPSNCSAGGKQRLYHGSVYHAAPSAPMLEISINQHNPPSSPCQSPSCAAAYSSSPVPPAASTPMMANPKVQSQRPLFCRPPDSPPPPPPQELYANPEYELPKNGRNRVSNNKSANKTSPQSRPNDRRESWRQLGRSASIRAVRAGTALRRKLYTQRNGLMFRLCLAELAFAGLLLALGILCASKTPEFCPYYSAIWIAAVVLLNAVVGLVAARLDTANCYVAHLVLSLGCFALSAIGAVLGAVNWHLIGRYLPNRMEPGHQLINPKADEREMYKKFCLLGEYDAPRIHYIGKHMRDYEFHKCLSEIKIGIGVNSLQFLLCIVLALLLLVSIIICLLRTCTSRVNVNGNGNSKK